MIPVPTTEWPHVVETPHDAMMTREISAWCYRNLPDGGWRVSRRRAGWSDPRSLGLDQFVIEIRTRDMADHLLALLVWG